MEIEGISGVRIGSVIIGVQRAAARAEAFYKLLCAEPKVDDSTPDASVRASCDIFDEIIAKSELVRTLRSTSTEMDAEAANVALSELLELKARYHTLTGEEYRKSTKRSRAGSAAEAPEGGSAAAPSDSTCASSSANGRRPKQPRVAKPKASEEPVDPMTLPPPADDFPPWAPRDFFRFELVHRSRKPGSRAHVGRIFTPHGVIETPAFVPVGTNAALKCLDERHARDAGVQLMFCNTYHLLVHPCSDVVSGAGGLHSWMQHEGPLITDSGGFQVFSLAEPNEDDAAGPEMKRKNKSRVANREGGAGGSSSLLSVSERGARFRSYHDGKEIEHGTWLVHGDVVLTVREESRSGQLLCRAGFHADFAAAAGVLRLPCAMPSMELPRGCPRVVSSM